MKSPFSRTLLLSLVAVFLSQAALTPLAEANFWSDRRAAFEKGAQKEFAIDHRSDLAALPAALGPAIPSFSQPLSLNRLTVFPSRKYRHLSPPLASLIQAFPFSTLNIQSVNDAPRSLQTPILLIQDVHQNTEAQMNIAKALIDLSESSAVGAVGVEAAFAPLDFTRLRAFDEKDIVKNAADAFLNANLLAAPSYAGIVSKKDPPLYFGIDDKVHYDANVKAYLDSVPLKEKTLATLKTEAHRLNDEKKRTFSPRMREFDGWRMSHAEGTLPLSTYLEKLATLSKADYSLTTERFLEASRLEKSLDFKSVERERAAVLEKLAKALKEQDLKSLLEESIAYKVGRLSFGDYYGRLKDLCEAHHIQLNHTPAFNNYLTYVFLADGLNAEQLFNDRDQLEEAVLKVLQPSGEELSLYEASRHVELAEKLVDFSLTPKEWEKYKEYPMHPLLTSPLYDVGRNSRVDGSLKSFEQFYEQADIRSGLMLDHLLQQNQSFNNAEPLVMVVGGFHTEEMSARLKKEGRPFIVASPKITKVDGLQGSSYLSMFTRDKAPIEKILSGEKLFLNKAGLNISNPTLLSRLLVNIAALTVFAKGPFENTRAGIKAWVTRGTAHIKSLRSGAEIEMILGAGEPTGVNTVPGALGIWKKFNITNLTLIGFLEGAGTALLHLLAMIIVRHILPISPTTLHGAIMFLVISAAILLPSTFILFWIGHFSTGILLPSRKTATDDNSDNMVVLSSLASLRAMSGAIGIPFFVIGLLLPGFQGWGFIFLGLLAPALFHAGLNPLSEPIGPTKTARKRDSARAMTKRTFIIIGGWMTLVAGLAGGLFVGDAVRKAAFNEFLKTDYQLGADENLNRQKFLSLLSTVERWLQSVGDPDAEVVGWYKNFVSEKGHLTWANEPDSMKSFSKPVDPNRAITVELNIPIVNSILHAVQSTKDEPAFASLVAGILAREAWGVKIVHDVPDILSKNFSHTQEEIMERIRNPAYQGLLTDEDHLRSVVSESMAQELFEVEKLAAFLDRMNQAGLYSPDQARGMLLGLKAQIDHGITEREWIFLGASAANLAHIHAFHQNASELFRNEHRTLALRHIQEYQSKDIDRNAAFYIFYLQSLQQTPAGTAFPNQPTPEEIDYVLNTDPSANPAKGTVIFDKIANCLMKDVLAHHARWEKLLNERKTRVSLGVAGAVAVAGAFGAAGLPLPGGNSSNSPIPPSKQFTKMEARRILEDFIVKNIDPGVAECRIFGIEIKRPIISFGEFPGEGPTHIVIKNGQPFVVLNLKYIPANKTQLIGAFVDAIRPWWQDSNRKYYEADKSHYEAENISRPIKWMNDVVIPQVMKGLPQKKGVPLSVLDVGIGSGAAGISFALRGALVTALDISKSILDIADNNARKYGTSLRLLESPMEDMENWAEELYDIVIVGISAGHLLEPDKLEWLKSVFHVLKPGGKFFVHEPISADEPDTHHLWSSEMWLSQLQAAGFEIEMLIDPTNKAYINIVCRKPEKNRTPIRRKSDTSEVPAASAGLRRRDFLKKFGVASLVASFAANQILKAAENSSVPSTPASNKTALNQPTANRQHGWAIFSSVLAMLPLGMIHDSPQPERSPRGKGIMEPDLDTKLIKPTLDNIILKGGAVAVSVSDLGHLEIDELFRSDPRTVSDHLLPVDLFRSVEAPIDLVEARGRAQALFEKEYLTGKSKTAWLIKGLKALKGFISAHGSMGASRFIMVLDENSLFAAHVEVPPDEKTNNDLLVIQGSDVLMFPDQIEGGISVAMHLNTAIASALDDERFRQAVTHVTGQFKPNSPALSNYEERSILALQRTSKVRHLLELGRKLLNEKMSLTAAIRNQNRRENPNEEKKKRDLGRRAYYQFKGAMELGNNDLSSISARESLISLQLDSWKLDAAFANIEKQENLIKKFKTEYAHSPKILETLAVAEANHHINRAIYFFKRAQPDGTFDTGILQIARGELQEPGSAPGQLLEMFKPMSDNVQKKARTWLRKINNAIADPQRERTRPANSPQQWNKNRPPVGMTGWWAGFMESLGFSKETAARLGGGEEILYSGILYFSFDWINATFGHLDPLTAILVKLPFMVLSILWFAYDHPYASHWNPDTGLIETSTTKLSFKERLEQFGGIGLLARLLFLFVDPQSAFVLAALIHSGWNISAAWLWPRFPVGMSFKNHDHGEDRLTWQTLLVNIATDEKLKASALNGTLTINQLSETFQPGSTNFPYKLNKMVELGYLTQQRTAGLKNIIFYRLTNAGFKTGLEWSSMDSLKKVLRYLGSARHVSWTMIHEKFHPDLVRILAEEISRLRARKSPGATPLDPSELTVADFMRKFPIFGKKSLYQILELKPYRMPGETPNDALARFKDIHHFKKAEYSNEEAVRAIRAGWTVDVGSLSDDNIQYLLEQAAQELGLMPGEMRFGRDIVGKKFKFLNNQLLTRLVPEPNQRSNFLLLMKRVGIPVIKTETEIRRERPWIGKYNDPKIVEQITGLPFDEGTLRDWRLSQVSDLDNPAKGGPHRLSFIQERALFREVEKENTAAMTAVFWMSTRAIHYILSELHMNRDSIDQAEYYAFRAIWAFSKKERSYPFSMYVLGYVTRYLERELKISDTHLTTLHEPTHEDHKETYQDNISNRTHQFGLKRRRVIEVETRDDILDGIERKEIADYVRNNGFSQQEKVVFNSFLEGRTPRQISAEKGLTRNGVRIMIRRVESKVVGYFKRILLKERMGSPAVGMTGWWMDFLDMFGISKENAARTSFLPEEFVHSFLLLVAAPWFLAKLGVPSWLAAHVGFMSPDAWFLTLKILLFVISNLVYGRSHHQVFKWKKEKSSFYNPNGDTSVVFTGFHLEPRDAKPLDRFVKFPLLGMFFRIGFILPILFPALHFPGIFAYFDGKPVRLALFLHFVWNIGLSRLFRAGVGMTSAPAPEVPRWNEVDYHLRIIEKGRNSFPEKCLAMSALIERMRKHHDVPCKLVVERLTAIFQMTPQTEETEPLRKILLYTITYLGFGFPKTRQLIVGILKKNSVPDDVKVSLLKAMHLMGRHETNMLLNSYDMGLLRDLATQAKMEELIYLALDFLEALLQPKSMRAFLKNISQLDKIFTKRLQTLLGHPRPGIQFLAYRILKKFGFKISPPNNLPPSIKSFENAEKFLGLMADYERSKDQAALTAGEMIILKNMEKKPPELLKKLMGKRLVFWASTPAGVVPSRELKENLRGLINSGVTDIFVPRPDSRGNIDLFGAFSGADNSNFSGEKTAIIKTTRDILRSAQNKGVRVNFYDPDGSGYEGELKLKAMADPLLNAYRQNRKMIVFGLSTNLCLSPINNDQGFILPTMATYVAQELGGEHANKLASVLDYPAAFVSMQSEYEGIHNLGDYIENDAANHSVAFSLLAPPPFTPPLSKLRFEKGINNTLANWDLFIIRKEKDGGRNDAKSIELRKKMLSPMIPESLIIGMTESWVNFMEFFSFTRKTAARFSFFYEELKYAGPVALSLLAPALLSAYGLDHSLLGIACSLLFRLIALHVFLASVLFYAMAHDKVYSWDEHRTIQSREASDEDWFVFVKMGAGFRVGLLVLAFVPHFSIPVLLAVWGLAFISHAVWNNILAWIFNWRVGMVSAHPSESDENIRQELTPRLRQALEADDPADLAGIIKQAAASELDYFIFVANLAQVISEQHNMFRTISKKIELATTIFLQSAPGAASHRPTLSHIHSLLDLVATFEHKNGIKLGENIFYLNYLDLLDPEQTIQSANQIDQADLQEILADMLTRDNNHFVRSSLAQLPGGSGHELATLPQPIKVLKIQQGRYQDVFLVLTSLDNGTVMPFAFLMARSTHVSPLVKMEYANLYTRRGNPHVVQVLQLTDYLYRGRALCAYSSAFLNNHTEVFIVDGWMGRQTEWRRFAFQINSSLPTRVRISSAGDFENILGGTAQALAYLYDPDHQTLPKRIDVRRGDLNFQESTHIDDNSRIESLSSKGAKLIAWRRTMEGETIPRFISYLFSFEYMVPAHNLPSMFDTWASRTSEDYIPNIILAGFKAGLQEKYGEGEGLKKVIEWLKIYLRETKSSRMVGNDYFRPEFLEEYIHANEAMLQSQTTAQTKLISSTSGAWFGHPLYIRHAWWIETAISLGIGAGLVALVLVSVHWLDPANSFGSAISASLGSGLATGFLSSQIFKWPHRWFRGQGHEKTAAVRSLTWATFITGFLLGLSMAYPVHLQYGVGIVYSVSMMGIAALSWLHIRTNKKAAAIPRTQSRLENFLVFILGRPLSLLGPAILLAVILIPNLIALDQKIDYSGSNYKNSIELSKGFEQSVFPKGENIPPQQGAWADNFKLCTTILRQAESPEQGYAAAKSLETLVRQLNPSDLDFQTIQMIGSFLIAPDCVRVPSCFAREVVIDLKKSLLDSLGEKISTYSPEIRYSNEQLQWFADLYVRLLTYQESVPVPDSHFPSVLPFDEATYFSELMRDAAEWEITVIFWRLSGEFNGLSQDSPENSVLREVGKFLRTKLIELKNVNTIQFDEKILSEKFNFNRKLRVQNHVEFISRHLLLVWNEDPLLQTWFNRQHTLTAAQEETVHRIPLNVLPAVDELRSLSPRFLSNLKESARLHDVPADILGCMPFSEEGMAYGLKTSMKFLAYRRAGSFLGWFSSRLIPLVPNWSDKIFLPNQWKDFISGGLLGGKNTMGVYQLRPVHVRRFQLFSRYGIDAQKLSDSKISRMLLDPIMNAEAYASFIEQAANEVETMRNLAVHIETLKKQGQMQEALNLQKEFDAFSTIFSKESSRWMNGMGPAVERTTSFFALLPSKENLGHDGWLLATLHPLYGSKIGHSTFLEGRYSYLVSGLADSQPRPAIVTGVRTVQDLKTIEPYLYRGNYLRSAVVSSLNELRHSDNTSLNAAANSILERNRQLTTPNTSGGWVKMLKLFGVKNPEIVAVKRIGWWAETAAMALVFFGLLWLRGIRPDEFLLSSYHVPGSNILWAAIGTLVVFALLVHLSRVVKEDDQLRTVPLWSAGPRAPPSLTVALKNVNGYLKAGLIYFLPFFAVCLIHPHNTIVFISLLIATLGWAASIHGLDSWGVLNGVPTPQGLGRLVTSGFIFYMPPMPLDLIFGRAWVRYWWNKLTLRPNRHMRYPLSKEPGLHFLNEKNFDLNKPTAVFIPGVAPYLNDFSSIVDGLGSSFNIAFFSYDERRKSIDEIADDLIKARRDLRLQGKGGVLFAGYSYGHLIHMNAVLRDNQNLFQNDLRFHALGGLWGGSSRGILATEPWAIPYVKALDWISTRLHIGRPKINLVEAFDPNGKIQKWLFHPDQVKAYERKLKYKPWAIYLEDDFNGPNGKFTYWPFLRWTGLLTQRIEKEFQDRFERGKNAHEAIGLKKGGWSAFFRHYTILVDLEAARLIVESIRKSAGFRYPLIEADLPDSAKGQFRENLFRQTAKIGKARWTEARSWLKSQIDPHYSRLMRLFLQARMLAFSFMPISNDTMMRWLIHYEKTYRSAWEPAHVTSHPSLLGVGKSKFKKFIRDLFRLNARSILLGISLAFVDVAISLKIGLNVVLRHLIDQVIRLYKKAMSFYLTRRLSPEKIAALDRKLYSEIGKSKNLEDLRERAKNFFMLKRGGAQWAEDAVKKFDDLQEERPSSDDYAGSKEILIYLLRGYLDAEMNQWRENRRNSVDLGLEFLRRKIEESANHPDRADPWIVKAAVRSLGSLGQYLSEIEKTEIIGTFEKVIEAKGVSDTIKSAAARGLREVMQFSTLKDILRILNVSSLSSGDKVVRGEFAWTEAYMVEAVQFFLERYRLERRGLSQETVDEVVAVLMNRLTGRDKVNRTVRINTIKALSKLRGIDQAVLDRLEENFMEEPSPSAQEAALNTMAKLYWNAPGPKEGLIKYLNRFIDRQLNNPPELFNPYLIRFAKYLLIRFLFKVNVDASVRAESHRLLAQKIPARTYGRENIFIAVDPLFPGTSVNPTHLSEYETSVLIKERQKAGYAVLNTASYRESRDEAKLTPDGHHGFQITMRLRSEEIVKDMSQLMQGSPVRTRSRDPGRAKTVPRMDRVLVPGAKGVVIVGLAKEAEEIRKTYRERFNRNMQGDDLQVTTAVGMTGWWGSLMETFSFEKETAVRTSFLPEEIIHSFLLLVALPGALAALGLPNWLAMNVGFTANTWLIIFKLMLFAVSNIAYGLSHPRVNFWKKGREKLDGDSLGDPIVTMGYSLEGREAGLLDKIVFYPLLGIFFRMGFILPILFPAFQFPWIFSVFNGRPVQLAFFLHFVWNMWLSIIFRARVGAAYVSDPNSPEKEIVHARIVSAKTIRLLDTLKRAGVLKNFMCIDFTQMPHVSEQNIKDIIAGKRKADESCLISLPSLFVDGNQPPYTVRGLARAVREIREVIIYDITPDKLNSGFRRNIAGLEKFNDALESILRTHNVSSLAHISPRRESNYKELFEEFLAWFRGTYLELMVDIYYLDSMHSMYNFNRLATRSEEMLEKLRPLKSTGNWARIGFRKINRIVKSLGALRMMLNNPPPQWRRYFNKVLPKSSNKLRETINSDTSTFQVRDIEETNTILNQNGTEIILATTRQTEPYWHMDVQLTIRLKGKAWLSGRPPLVLIKADGSGYSRQGIWGVTSLIDPNPRKKSQSWENVIFKGVKPGRYMLACPDPAKSPGAAGVWGIFGLKHTPTIGLLEGLGIALVGQMLLPNLTAFAENSVISLLSAHMMGGVLTVGILYAALLWIHGLFGVRKYDGMLEHMTDISPRTRWVLSTSLTSIILMTLTNAFLPSSAPYWIYAGLVILSYASGMLPHALLNRVSDREFLRQTNVLRNTSENLDRQEAEARLLQLAANTELPLHLDQFGISPRSELFAMASSRYETALKLNPNAASERLAFAMWLGSLFTHGKEAFAGTLDTLARVQVNEPPRYLLDQGSGQSVRSSTINKNEIAAFMLHSETPEDAIRDSEILLGKFYFNEPPHGRAYLLISDNPQHMEALKKHWEGRTHVRVMLKEEGLNLKDLVRSAMQYEGLTSLTDEDLLRLCNIQLLLTEGTTIDDQFLGGLNRELIKIYFIYLAQRIPLAVEIPIGQSLKNLKDWLQTLNSQA